MSQRTAAAEFQPALSRLGGSVELLCELARFYLEDAGGLITAMESGVQSGDARAAERAAHSLKGLAANFDAEQLITHCAAAEDAARRGDLAEYARQLPAIHESSQRLESRLRELLDQQ